MYHCSLCTSPTGSVVTWGHDARGGDSPEVFDFLSNNIVQVLPSWRAMAALHNNGTCYNYFIIFNFDKSRGRIISGSPCHPISNSDSYLID